MLSISAVCDHTLVVSLILRVQRSTQSGVGADRRGHALNDGPTDTRRDCRVYLRGRIVESMRVVRVNRRASLVFARAAHVNVVQVGAVGQLALLDGESATLAQRRPVPDDPNDHEDDEQSERVAEYNEHEPHVAVLARERVLDYRGRELRCGLHARRVRAARRHNSQMRRGCLVGRSCLHVFSGQVITRY